jgi:hypothetical protein
MLTRETRDADGRSMLVAAVFYQKPEIVELLLNNNSDINSFDKLYNSALHHAGMLQVYVCTLHACVELVWLMRSDFWQSEDHADAA